MKMVPVTSDNVQKLGYFPSARVLRAAWRVA